MKVTLKIKNGMIFFGFSPLMSVISFSITLDNARWLIGVEATDSKIITKPILCTLN